MQSHNLDVFASQTGFQGHFVSPKNLNEPFLGQGHTRVRAPVEFQQFVRTQLERCGVDPDDPVAIAEHYSSVSAALEENTNTKIFLKKSSLN